MSLLSILGGGLARLLIRGFERALAKTVSRAITSEALTGLILGQEPSLTSQEAAALADFVKAGQRVAEVLERRDAPSPLTIEDFPQNPYALGDAPGGNRFITDGVVDVFDKNGNFLKSFNVSVKDLDIPDNESLAEAMGERAREIFKKYYQDTVDGTDDGIDTKLSIIHFSERAF